MKESRPKEFVAVPLVSLLLGALFLVLAAAAAGVWAWIVAGVLIVFGAAYGWRSLRRSGLGVDDDVPVVASRRDPTSFHVLVLADDRCAPEALRRTVEEHAAGRPVTAYVVAPAASSRLDRLTGDEAAYERASENLSATLESLEGVATIRDGKVGSHDPLQAIEEALREFPAEEILVPAQSEQSVAAETKFGVHVAALTS